MHGVRRLRYLREPRAEAQLPIWGQGVLGPGYPGDSGRADPVDKLTKLWASIDNNKSVWLTKRTLINLLMRFRFTSVYGVTFR